MADEVGNADRVAASAYRFSRRIFSLGAVVCVRIAKRHRIE